MKQSEIGAACGLATSTVSDIANGRIKEPGGDAALALHLLHVERCSPRETQPAA
jgi:predicted XRE-type DNA-binding protein